MRTFIFLCCSYGLLLGTALYAVAENDCPPELVRLGRSVPTGLDFEQAFAGQAGSFSAVYPRLYRQLLETRAEGLHNLKWVALEVPMGTPYAVLVEAVRTERNRVAAKLRRTALDLEKNRGKINSEIDREIKKRGGNPAPARRRLAVSDSWVVFLRRYADCFEQSTPYDQGERGINTTSPNSYADILAAVGTTRVSASPEKQPEREVFLRWLSRVEAQWAELRVALLLEQIVTVSATRLDMFDGSLRHLPRYPIEALSRSERDAEIDLLFSGANGVAWGEVKYSRRPLHEKSLEFDRILEKMRLKAALRTRLNPFTELHIFLVGGATENVRTILKGVGERVFVH